MVDLLEFDVPSFVVVYRATSWILMGALVWAPIAGLLTARAAHKNKLDPVNYGWLGAWHAALFFIPWLHLMTRLTRSSIPVALPKIIYVTFCAVIWLFGSVCTTWWFATSFLASRFLLPWQ